MFDYPFDFYSPIRNPSSYRNRFPYESEFRRNNDLRNELLRRQFASRKKDQNNDESRSFHKGTNRPEDKIRRTSNRAHRGTRDTKSSRVNIPQDENKEANGALWDIDTCEGKTSKTQNTRQEKPQKSKSVKKGKNKNYTSYFDGQESVRSTSSLLYLSDDLVKVEDASDDEDDFAYSKSLRPSIGNWMEPNYDYASK